MRSALKVVPPILLFWPMTSEAGVGGMAVEVEFSRQYSITFCCCMMASEGQPDKMVPDMKVYMVLPECLCRQSSECEHSGVIGDAFQQWQQRMKYKACSGWPCSVQALVHCL